MNQPREEVTIAISGPAGSGVFVAGSLLAKALMYGGYSVFVANEYPSLIRGGNNWVQVRACSRRVYSHIRRADLLLALDSEAVRRWSADAKALLAEPEDLDGICVPRYPVPLSDLAEERKARNVAALGACIALLGYDLDLLVRAIMKRFSERDAEVNVRTAVKAFNYVERTFGLGALTRLRPLRPLKSQLLISGNDAVVLGAIKAGLRLFAAYPITPASPILHLLAEIGEKYGVIVVQAESEIAAANIVLGAVCAGARAMTATSGPGLSLMAETLSQASMLEAPMVIVHVQRRGPSTGMPTYTSQSDLRFAVHAGHGESVKAIVAPGDFKEVYELTAKAFEVAWRYRLPVIVMLDKYLAESYGSVCLEVREKPPKQRLTPTVFLGAGGAVVKFNSSEHDDYGLTCNDPEVARRRMEARLKKVEALRREIESSGGVKVYGAESRVAIISWGSSKLPIIEAMSWLEREGVYTRFIQVVWLEPFPVNSIKRALVPASRLVVVECSATPQLASLLREHVGVEPDYEVKRYDGRPLDPEQVYERVIEVV